LEIVLLAVAVIAGAAFMVVLIGFLLPKQNVASRTIVPHRKPEDVFRLISDFKAAPSWRSDVEEVELLPPTDGHIRFRGKGPNGAITMEIVELNRPSRMVSRIADKSLPLWRYVDFRCFLNARGMPLEHYRARRDLRSSVPLRLALFPGLPPYP